MDKHMPFPSQSSVRVNIKAVVNNAMIRREKRNGKDYIIVPSATLPDDVVMNGIKYPAAEIEKSYQTLDRTYATFGHPKVNGVYVSAREPEALNDNYYVGAFNENVRRENGRVFLDKAIDVAYAMQSDKGRALLDAINKGEPIHTSTGVYLELNEDVEPKEAKNMLFDHDAILIGEEGAATPSQGVGVFVNSDNEPQAKKFGSNESILAINSILPNACDPYDSDVEWAAKHLIESIERSEKAKKSKGMLENFIALVRETLSGNDKTEASGLDQTNGNEENTMPITDEQFKALADKVETLATNAESIAKTVADAVAQAVKPLTEQLNTIKANEKAKEEAERTELVAKVVVNALLEEADAKELTTNALRKLAAKTPTGAAAPIFAGGDFQANGKEDGFKDYDPNAAIDAAMKEGK